MVNGDLAYSTWISRSWLTDWLNEYLVKRERLEILTIVIMVTKIYPIWIHYRVIFKKGPYAGDLWIFIFITFLWEKWDNFEIIVETTMKIVINLIKYCDFYYDLKIFLFFLFKKYVVKITFPFFFFSVVKHFLSSFLSANWKISIQGIVVD